MFVPVGATGTVTEVEAPSDETQSRVVIALDEPYAQSGCDGGWSYYPERDPPFEPSPVAAFWRHFEVI